MTIPQQVILELQEELTAFRGVVCEIDMPTVDMEAALEQIFESIQKLRIIEHELTITSINMSDGEGLFENNDLNDDTKERIMNAVLQIGYDIKNKLTTLHAYRNGYFPYEFRRLLNDNTVLLTRTNA